MAVYSKGIIDKKVNQINTNITNTAEALQNDYNSKIETEKNNRRNDIKKIINGGTTEDGDVIATGMDQVLITLYGQDKKPDSEDEKGRTNILQQIIQNLPAPGSNPMSPNQIVITGQDGKITSSGVSVNTLNILNTIPTTTGTNLTTILNNSINKTYRVNGVLNIGTATPPTTNLSSSTANGWYYVNTTNKKNSLYVYRVNIKSNEFITIGAEINPKIYIINPIEVSVDFNFMTAKSTYAAEDDNLVNSINNYGNIIGVDWKKNGTTRYNNKDYDNLLVDVYFYNRNQDNRWFEFINNSIFIKYGILCGGV